MMPKTITVRELKVLLEDFEDDCHVYVQADTVHNVAIVAIPPGDEYFETRAGRFANDDDTIVAVAKIS